MWNGASQFTTFLLKIQIYSVLSSVYVQVGQSSPWIVRSTLAGYLFFFPWRLTANYKEPILGWSLIIQTSKFTSKNNKNQKKWEDDTPSAPTKNFVMEVPQDFSVGRSGFQKPQAMREVGGPQIREFRCPNCPVSEKPQWLGWGASKWLFKD